MIEDNSKIVQIENEKLKNVRHERGIYSIKELSIMFDCHRKKIDDAINHNGLHYMSPNGRTRFIYLADYLSYIEKKNSTNKTELHIP